VEGLILPRVRRLTASDCPFPLSPFALVYVTEGELLLQGSDLADRLVVGEVLALRGDVRLRLVPARRPSEALLFQASPNWAMQALALFGAGGSADTVEPMVREASGNALARRAGRLMLAAYLEASPRTDDAASAEPAFEGAGRLAELVAIAHVMTGSLVAARPAAGARRRSRRPGLVRALEELETAQLEGFSLGVLAQRLGISRRHASRLLREELGTSLPEYLTGLRIERAKKLLATTRQPVTEVALETGWQSVSHFNTVFRRRVGITPSAYRVQALARVDVAAKGVQRSG
jgi:AraC-like DNA-binding protein